MKRIQTDLRRGGLNRQFLADVALDVLNECFITVPIRKIRLGRLLRERCGHECARQQNEQGVQLGLGYKLIGWTTRYKLFNDFIQQRIAVCASWVALGRLDGEAEPAFHIGSDISAHESDHEGNR